MVDSYNIDKITLGMASNDTGHVTYHDAAYTDGAQSINIIYKENKRGRAEFSRLEVTFSELAVLFLSPGLTSPTHLVVNNGDVSGLAIKHLRHIIEEQRGSECSYYQLNNQQVDLSHTKNTFALKDIPIYFLDKLPQGFYAKLVKDGNISIDYDSLASILTTSYTLEEDDLHKGNFGFYLIEKDEKPHAVFFKIDHDLMFVDSIMGYKTRRQFHLFDGAGAFASTERDLLSFPVLINSTNSFWPTNFCYITNPLDNKNYHNFAEIEAFSNLAGNTDFIKAKWKNFYKHILMPTVLIKQAILKHTDMEQPSDRAKAALVTQAITARLANVRAALFSTKKFREYVVGLDEQAKQDLLSEISPSVSDVVNQNFGKYHTLCSAADGFAEGDTPLHIAIKLGEYRYEDTLRMFGHFINVTNNAGQTPLDVALERVQSVGGAEKDLKFIFAMKHLLKNGAQKTDLFKASELSDELDTYTFKYPELEKITPETSYTDFKNILRDIGEAHQFCLKSQKIFAVKGIQKWIELQQNQPGFQRNLTQLKNDINGNSAAADSDGVKYIRQLRSELWVVRQVRGLYGLTTTQREVNSLIDQALERCKPKEPGVFSMFYHSRQFDQNNVDPRPAFQV